MILETIKYIQETAPFGKEFAFVLSLLLLIGLVYKPMMSFWHDFKRGRIKKLEEVLNSSYIDADTKKFIEANLSEEYFKLGTGMALSHDFRVKLMQLYHKNNSPIAFVHYKRVMDYMKYEGGEIKQVRIPKFLEIIGYCMVVLGLTMLVKIVIWYFQSFFTGKQYSLNSIQDLLNILGLYLLFVFFVVISVFLVVKPYIIYTSAKFVNRQIGAKYESWYYQALYYRNRMGVNRTREGVRLRSRFNFRKLYYIVILLLAGLLGWLG